MGLRVKIGTTIAATSTIAVLVTAVQVPGMLTDRERETVAERLQFAERIYDESGETRFGLRLNPANLPVPLREQLDRGRRATHVQDTPQGKRIWAGAPTERGYLVMTGRRSPVIDELEQVMWKSGAVGVGVAGLIGVAVAARFGRRLRLSAQAAERITRGELSARLSEKGRDEITVLTRAVNAMAEALGGRLQAEREVTANIAHELRTPVAGLVAAAGLLPEGTAENMVRERVGRLRDLVEDVLEVARLDNGGEDAEMRWVESGVLARRAARAAVEGRAVPGRPAPAVRVEVVRDMLVHTDPRRVERVLTNLVSNSLRHGAQPVLVEVTGQVIRVRDHGSGFPVHLLSHGPQRFRTGAAQSGLGLGLTIAAAQAQLIGAELRFTNPPGGGAQALLDLGTPPPRRADGDNDGDRAGGSDGGNGSNNSSSGDPA
ncbi:sensor histidine kinase [Streptomyces sp. CB00455]|uniref:sensor histidine kinase n=1 Tax=Streptomyces sp. CB00455 TaxID=1703927 RepID=UPI000938DC41|nr:HAMP domain-containing sensor histidine kinase [Streptomyces sp. CB00455]